MTATAAAPLLRVLVETNIVLDAVLARAPHDRDAVLLLDAIDRHRLDGYVAGHCVTTVHHVVQRETNRTTAVTAVQDVLAILRVVPLGDVEFQRALAMGLRDFEDAVQAAACLTIGADFIVTRNERDFKGASVTTKQCPGPAAA